MCARRVGALGLLFRVCPGAPRCVLYATHKAHNADRAPGFEPRELIGSPSLDLVHPDEFPQVRAIHYSTITQDQAAVLVYLRMRHKDPCKGYVLCAIVSPKPSYDLPPLMDDPDSREPYVKTSL